MNAPKISIVVPVYNVDRYLRQCMDSLVSQTFVDIEIVCVNDGSTDDSINILNHYAKNDRRVKIISQENAGASSARNTGIKHCIGEYIMFVDGDDWIDIDTCEMAYKAAKKYDVDLVLWSYVREFANITLPKRIFGFESCYLDEKQSKRMIFKRCIGICDEGLSNPENMDSIVTVWGKLYKKELIYDIRFIDMKEIGSEDLLFNVYALSRINSAYYIDEYKNHYRKDNDSSLTKTYSPELYIKWQRLYNYIEEFLLENKMPDEYKKALYNRISLGILGLGLNIVSSEMTITQKIREIKKIISSDRYINAYRQLELTKFPIHWKIFYGFAKYNFAAGLCFMLICIKKIINR